MFFKNCFLHRVDLYEQAGKPEESPGLVFVSRKKLFTGTGGVIQMGFVYFISFFSLLTGDLFWFVA